MMTVYGGLQVAQFLYRQLGLDSGDSGVNAVITNGRVSFIYGLRYSDENHINVCQS